MIAIVTMASCSDDIMDSTDSPNLANSPTFGVFEEKQAIACKTYQKLLDSFQTDKTKSISSTDYPTFYGGAFINENGDLVVNTVGDSIQSRRSLTEKIGDLNIQTQVCQYSYKALSSTMDKLNDYMFDESNKVNIEELGLNSIYLSDKDNKIFVELENFSSEEIQKFKSQVITSPMIEYKKSESLAVVHADINCGSGIESANVGSYYLGSVGYRARGWDNRPGFVASAHVITNNYQDVFKNGLLIGNATQRQLSGPGGIDAVLIEVNSSYTPTNYIEKTGEFVPTTVLEPIMGTRVSMRGYTTQAVSSGVITNTNATVRFTMPDKSVITFSNLAGAGYYGAAGDSGGIVFSSGTATYGIHEGGGNGVSYFIKASVINKAFSISRY